MKITIGKKLSIGAIAGLALIVMLSIVAYSSLSKISKTNDVVVSLFPKMEEVDQLQFTLAEALKINDFFVSGDLEKRSSFELSSMAVDKAIERVEKIELDSEEKSTFGKVKKEFALLKEKSQVIFETVKASGQSFLGPTVNKLVDDVDAVALSLVEDSEYLYELSHKELSLAIQKAEQTKQWGIRTTRAISIAGILFAIAGSFVLTRNITKPIQALTSATRIITEGDLDKRVNIKSSDEIGQLASAFNYMTAKLKDFYTNLEEKVSERTKELDETNQELQKEIVERERTEEKLTRKQKNLEALFDVAPVGMLLVDENMIVKRSNNVISQIVCREYSQIINQQGGVALGCINSTYNEKGCGHSPACAVCSIRKTVESVLDSERSVHGVEIQPTLKVDNKEVTPWLRISAEPVMIDGCKHAIIAIDDITKRKQAEHELEALNRELEVTVRKLTLSNRELQDFTRIAAHDLKAPLRAIGTLADWISTDCSDKFDEQGKKRVKLLVGRAERMSKHIDAILEYSEIGRTERKKGKVNLNVLLTEIIREIAPPEDIAIVIENELPLIMCEKTHMMLVFQNLLSNAVKYMDKPKGRIEVGCVEENGFWKFSVADNGPGIEEKYFEKIFKMFQTLSPRDEFESTGIGLSVVKKIVGMYGGNIWVESEAGDGSTFFFTFPQAGGAVENERQLLISCC